MRVAVVSDVHSNLPALEAVLAETGEAGVDEIWCLGDIVGYGPDPAACVEIIRARCAVSLSGNHDLGSIGAISIDDFNPYAAEANLWTGSVLSGTDREWLGSLPSRTSRHGVTLAHGSPREPIWEYVLSAKVAVESFRHFDSDWCLVGHSHVPLLAIELTPGGSPGAGPTSGEPVEPLGRAIINPGSVGQPRDGDPRAAYAILDLERRTVQHCRVAYDIKAVQARMSEAGLPSYLIERLERGH